MWDIFNCCCPCVLDQTPTLKVNGSKFRILNVLGEGGFSFVYLVESTRNKSKYALKKVNCSYNNGNFQQTMKELEFYREFKSPYIIHLVGSSIVQEPDGSKTVYILLPYFKNGTLQDIIDKDSVDESNISEKQALRYFVGICRGLIAMHRHQLSTNTRIRISQNFQSRDPFTELSSNEINSGNGTSNDDSEERNPFLSHEEENNRRSSSSTRPLTISSESDLSQNSIISEDGTELSETISIAHRDIKPANIMLSEDGTAVLCDLGSCEKVNYTIQSQSQALSIQENINERCTLAYRAPELIDVSSGDKITDKVDIWSLGCTLYALLYGFSPFEREEMSNGANMSLAISSGKYSFPDSPIYSTSIKNLIKFCIEVDPSKRPSIEDVLNKALEAQRLIEVST